jgi:hypothetical protein
MNGDLIKKIQDNLNNTPQQRIGDENILLLARRVQELEQGFHDKFNNGITKKFEDILIILNRLPCALHNTMMENIIETTNLKLKNLESKTIEIVTDKLQKTSQYRIGIIVGLICALPGLISVLLKMIEMMRH